MKQQLSPVVMVVVIVVVLALLAGIWYFAYGKPKPSKSATTDPFKGQQLPPEMSGGGAPAAPGGSGGGMPGR